MARRPLPPVLLALLLPAALGLPAPALAFRGCAPGGLVKVVIQNTTPGAPSGAPKTLYRQGSSYGRLEDGGAGGSVVIVNGKDTWIVDLAAKKGEHLTDPSSTPAFHAPIAPDPEDENALEGFEFGCELSFMRQRAVTPESVTVGGRTMRLFKWHEGRYTVQLLVLADKDVPYAASVHKDGKPFQMVRYVEYADGQKPDPALFTPPEGFLIVEG